MIRLVAWIAAVVWVLGRAVASLWRKPEAQPCPYCAEERRLRESGRLVMFGDLPELLEQRRRAAAYRGR